MRKVLIYIIWGIVLVLVGFCVYMESKHSTFRMVKSEMTQEKVVEEYPEIAITQDDLELENYVLELPEVQTMVKQSKESGSYISLSNEKALELLAGWIDDRWTMIYLGCEDNTVYLFCVKAEDKLLTYNFSVDGSYPIQKTIGIYQKQLNETASVDTLYENVNGIIEKHVFKRQWFYWVNELFING